LEEHFVNPLARELFRLDVQSGALNREISQTSPQECQLILSA
jgi:hypothetical protein